MVAGQVSHIGGYVGMSGACLSVRARHGPHFRPRNCDVGIYIYSARENAT